MRCINTSECFEQMSAYFDGKKTGYFLLVNTENYDVYQEILQRLEADSCKRCVYILNFLSFLTLNANCSHHLSPSGSS